MDFIQILQGIHSFVRWIIVIVAVVGIVFYAMSWLGSLRNPSMANGLQRGFTGLMDLELALGLLLIFGKGITDATYRVEHAGTMILAVALAHVPMFWRKGDPRIIARNNMLVIIGVLVIIFVGISFLPQGWF